MYFVITLLVTHISGLTENYTETQPTEMENDSIYNPETYFQRIENDTPIKLIQTTKFIQNTEINFEDYFMFYENNETLKSMTKTEMSERSSNQSINAEGYLTQITESIQELYPENVLVLQNTTNNSDIYDIVKSETNSVQLNTGNQEIKGFFFQISEYDEESNSFFRFLTSEIKELNILVISYEKNAEQLILNYLPAKTIVSPFETIKLLDENTKFDLFIILINSLDHITHFLHELFTDFGLQNRAKFIFIKLNKDVNIEDIFKLTWNVYIQNILVLQRDRIWEMYTHFPYASGKCGRNVTPVKVNKEHLFPRKIELDMQGCEVRLMGLHIQPYVLDVTKPKDDPTVAGVEVTIIHNILKKMNFTERYIPNPHPHWGFYFENGEFTMIYKALHEKQTDIGFGMMIGNETIEKHFDCSVQNIDTTAVWFVPTALPIAQWKNLTVIFDGIVWSAIFFVFMLNGVVWYVLGRTRETSASYNELSLCIMGSFYILLQGSFTTPEAWKLRFIVVIWSVSSLLIFTAHQCQLTGILTSPLYEHQISTLKELVESNLEYGFYPVLKDLYSDPTNEVRWKVLMNFKPCSLTQTCMNRTAFKRDFAVIKNQRQGAYFMPKYYTSNTGKPMLYVFKSSECVVWCKYYVPKGYPFLDRINDLILLLQSNGLIGKWDADIVAGPKGDDDRTELEPLTLNHLQGAFLLLIFGTVLSTCMFTAEKCYFQVWGKNKREIIEHSAKEKLKHDIEHLETISEGFYEEE